MSTIKGGSCVYHTCLLIWTQYRMITHDREIYKHLNKCLFSTRLHCTHSLLTHITTFVMTHNFLNFHKLISFYRHKLRHTIYIYIYCRLGGNNEACMIHSDYHTLHFSCGFIGVPFWHWNASEKASKFCREPKTLMQWDMNRDEMDCIIIFTHTQAHFMTYMSNV